MLEAYCQDDKGRVWLYILHQFYGEILFWRCMGFSDFYWLVGFKVYFKYLTYFSFNIWWFIILVTYHFRYFEVDRRLEFSKSLGIALFYIIVPRRFNELVIESIFVLGAHFWSFFYIQHKFRKIVLKCMLACSLALKEMEDDICYFPTWLMPVGKRVSEQWNVMGQVLKRLTLSPVPALVWV